MMVRYLDDKGKYCVGDDGGLTMEDITFTEEKHADGSPILVGRRRSPFTGGERGMGARISEGSRMDTLKRHIFSALQIGAASERADRGVITTFTHRCPLHAVVVDQKGSCGPCGSRDALVELDKPVVSEGALVEATV